MNYTKPVHVMLIDDNEINNFIVKKIIGKVCKNSTFITCLNTEEALRTLLRLKSYQDNSLPDYIFFEVNSPDMNGWQFLDEYERLSIDDGNAGRIIVLTCSLFQTCKEKALRYLSVGGYIIKPLTIASFNSLLGHRLFLT